MSPYKDPAKQRKCASSWITRVRHEWLATQECSLCGHKTDLSTFRHTGAPKLYWTLKGPSHEQYRVVCSDPSECLYRRAELGEKAPTPSPVVSSHARKLGKYEKRKPLERDELPIMVERHARARSRLEKELAKPNGRPRCPKHGPKGTMRFDKRVRFVCCGREVGGVV